MHTEQQKHPEWSWQWERLSHGDDWLFDDWILPNTMETFRGKRVLDAGCGGGQHSARVATVAREVVAMDLNTAELSRGRLANLLNVRVVDGDIATVKDPEGFDVVYSIGVIHHTDDPDVTFRNLASLTKPGGRTIVWVYSWEGNFLNRVFVEGLKDLLIHHLPNQVVRAISWLMTVLLYLPVYTLYLLPLRSLPYYEYFENFRKLTFEQNYLNVFDKLNAPQTHFIKQERIERWFKDNGFTDVHISPYRGVSWRGSGTKV